MVEDFRLYGDDFNQDAIEQWFLEEAQYHNQFSGGRFEDHPKLYQVFDWYYALLPYFHPRPQTHVLDFGCAEGQALAHLPDERRTYSYVGVDASRSLLERAARVHPEGEYRLMPANGIIPAKDGEFDYVVVLGVLHHVPNVSHYLKELFRVLGPGGRLILREPSHAMGRMPGSHTMLPGLSPNERGIPAHYLQSQLKQLGMRVLSLRPAYHGAVLQVLQHWQPRSDQAWRVLVSIDKVLSVATRWNDHYQRRKIWQKLAPTANYVVAAK